MGGGVSAEDIKKAISGETTDTYLGSYGGYSPMLDLVNRLSGDLNQYNAESNLYKGGSGYGGSFESAAQRAARANGQQLGATPYGGAGGYGSSNPVMTKNPYPGTTTATGGQPVPIDDPPYPIGGPPDGGGWGRRPVDYGTPTVNPGDPTAIPFGSGGDYGSGPNPISGAPSTGGWGRRPIGGGTPTTTPVASNPIQLPTDAQWYQPAPSTPYYAPKKAAVANSVNQSYGSPADAFNQVNPSTKEGLARLADPQFMAAAQAGYKAEMAKNNRPAGEMPWYLDPQLVKLQNDLVAGGMDPGAMGPNWANVREALSQGATVDQIKKHYQTLTDKYGPQATSMMHGSAARFKPDSMVNGTATKKAIENIGPGTGYVPQGPANTTTTKKSGVLGDGGMTVASNYAAFSPDAPNMVLTQPEEYTDADGNVWQLNKDGQWVLKRSPGMPSGTGGTSGGGTTGNGPNAGGDGNNGNPGGNSGGQGHGNPTGPPVGTTTGTHGDTGNGTYFDPKAGKNWGQLSNPPKGAKPGDYWQLPDGSYQTLGYSGAYHILNYNSKIGQFTVGGNGPAGAVLHDLPVINPPSDWDYQNYGTLKAPKEPGGNMPVRIGATNVIGYDGEGNPVYNDNGMFEQGDNATGVGDVTPDAWSTSAPWRPEEPTGGVYGAFSDLAGGKMTDYENQIGTNWRNYASDPSNPQDAGFEKMLAEYNKTPGKGIDEAYGAYNQMINGGGYSADEKGAIEGSAVRGVTQGYQRNMDDIRRQAARTGNANSAYAAMASQAGNYGGQLGETNRQNQLKFADEAERRKEAGAQGMTNVASLATTKSTAGLGLQQQYANELARRKEAGIKGMGDYATFGRGLQAQGIAGLQDMLKNSQAEKNNTYNLIAQLLGTKTGGYSSGTSRTNSSGWDVGVGYPTK